MSSIDCERALREIELFLDGELDPSEVALLRKHLGNCPPCGDRADFHRRLKELLANKCHEQLPAALHARIHEVLEGRVAAVDASDPYPPRS